MTYIQTVLFYLSVLIFLAGLLLLALSTKDQDAGGDVIDAEYRPAEEPAFPPCARRSHGWQDSPSRKLASQLFAESVSPKLLQAMQRHTKELEKVQRWRYYAEHAKKGRTRKKYRKKLREYYKGRPVFLTESLSSMPFLDSGVSLASGPGYSSGKGLSSGIPVSEAVWWARRPDYQPGSYVPDPSSFFGSYSYCPPHGSRFFRVDANGDLGYPGDSMTAQFMGGRKRWHM